VLSISTRLQLNPPRQALAWHVLILNAVAVVAKTAQMAALLVEPSAVVVHQWSIDNRTNGDRAMKFCKFLRIFWTTRWALILRIVMNLSSRDVVEPLLRNSTHSTSQWKHEPLFPGNVPIDLVKLPPALWWFVCMVNSDGRDSWLVTRWWWRLCCYLWKLKRNQS
jgi:hypothetical protein